ncbi:MAG TPA: helix-turn-helix domain-containing protein [Vicinamibacterales bacterium]|nr:helix-turn-helix domain-containing protein [Vicinamibacterales bacterium]
MKSISDTQLADVVVEAGLRDGQMPSLRDARRAFERHYILTVLERCEWRVGAAARALGLQRPNLYRKARQLSIQLKRADTPPAA